MEQPETRNPKPETEYSEIRNPQPVLSPVEVSELERRARALACLPTEEEVEGETLHLVTFPLREERYGVEITLVQGIQPLEGQTWSRVPCTPSFIVGAINIRGRIYSVMDIASFLGLPSRPLSETAHVLLVRNGGQGAAGEMELGILADDLPQVVNVPLAEVEPSSATISNQAQKYVRGVTADMLIILDLGRLLSDPGIRVHEEV
jgi:purine-binding chemotaxis protein CheW